MLLVPLATAIGILAGVWLLGARCSFEFLLIRYRFPDVSLTPKFHLMVYEHQRMMKKYGMCGMTTEEFIEVLHRDENEHRRLVR